MNRRHYGFLALCALGLGLAACSTSGNSSNNNPLGGVTIIQPAAPTPTPVPTPSPTPAPSSTDVLTDSGFESGGFAAGWSKCSIPRVVVGSTASPLPTPFPTVAPGSVGAVIISASSPPFVESPNPSVTPAIHSGSYAALTYSGAGAATVYGGGPAGLNGVCQTFTVPTDAVLNMYVNEGASDTGLKYADQEADIVTSSGTVINLFQELYGLEPGGGGDWESRGPFALTAAPYNLTPGESVTIFAGSFDSDPSAKYGVYMFVDDVTVIGTVPAAGAVRKPAARQYFVQPPGRR